MISPETIAAVSTPAGVGGIGIIRISGPQALAVARRIFVPLNAMAEWPSHRLLLGYIVDPHSGHKIDQVFLAYMKAPKTYTREDVVEIQCHSGPLVLKKILELALQSGARTAEPGEFTLRAFLNGRIDLTQAEGVIELIQARSEQALLAANKLLQGELQKTLKGLEAELLDLLAQLEGSIEFPEEDLEPVDRLRWASELEKKVLGTLDRLIQDYDRGRLFREGLSLVIVGKPNVGKSSLLNRLLQEERALVTPVPGTTRDTVEETLLLKGLPFRLVDTAGLRRSADLVEMAGIARTRDKIREALVLLFVLDISRPLDQEDLDIYREIQEKPMLLLGNKADLPRAVSEEEIRKRFPGPEILSISALFGQGLETLKDKLHALVTGLYFSETLPDLIPTVRQKTAFEEMSQALKRALTLTRENQPPELVAFYLQQALTTLGMLLGRITTEDVLERVFSRFCIGK